MSDARQRNPTADPDRAKHLVAGLTPEEMARTLVDNGELLPELGARIAEIVSAEVEVER